MEVSRRPVLVEQGIVIMREAGLIILASAVK
jgi:hypothetical protein